MGKYKVNTTVIIKLTYFTMSLSSLLYYIIILLSITILDFEIILMFPL